MKRLSKTGWRLLPTLALLLMLPLLALASEAEPGTEEHAWVTEDNAGTVAAPYAYNDSYAGVSQYATVANQKAGARLNLRDRPSVNGQSLGQYYNGTSVKILSYAGDWCYVEVNGRVGYMMTRYLSFNSTHDDDITYAVLTNPNGGSKVNLRSGPGTSAAIIGTFPVGTPVTIYSYGASWSYVQVSGYNGYVATSFLTYDIPPHPAPNPLYFEYAVVSNQNANARLNLREQPTTNSRSLGQYYNGTPVTVMNFGADWCYVDVYNQAGYMMTRYLSFIDYRLYNEYAGDVYDPNDDVQPFNPLPQEEDHPVIYDQPYGLGGVEVNNEDMATAVPDAANAPAADSAGAAAYEDLG